SFCLSPARRPRCPTPFPYTTLFRSPRWPPARSGGGAPQGPRRSWHPSSRLCGPGAAGDEDRRTRMHHSDQTLEAAVYAMAEGIATRDQIALLESDTTAWRVMLERLIDDTEDRLDDVRRIPGPERDQIVADFTQELARLDASYDLLTKATDPLALVAGADPAGEVRLQASWEAGHIVVWAAGPGTPPE